MAAPLEADRGRKIRVEVTPIARSCSLPGRVCGAVAGEAAPGRAAPLTAGMLRGGDWKQGEAVDRCLAQQELLGLEAQLRETALSESRTLLLALDAQPVVELSSRASAPVLPPRGWSSLPPGAPIAGVGVHQLLPFPITRFNGVQLPADARIRFGDVGRWLSGGSESRMFTISVEGTSKFYSWDAHAPVGKTPHAYYHVNQKGMFAVFGQADHAQLSGPALVQARQLRYLKLGGRVFLVVGVVVDGIQLGAAAHQSYQTGSARPVAAQAVRTAGSWAAAWAGAKAGVALGALAGVETGPGLVLTAIGGGLIGGLAGYWGADWIADWVYEN